MNRKVALVTSAGKGSPIGLSIARAFAAAGYDLVITARNKGRLKNAAAELTRDCGVDVMPVVLDVTDSSIEASIAQLAKSIEGGLGRLDVLVNTAQAAKVGDTLQNAKLSDLELSLKAGLVPAFLLMRECYPLLKESRGTVINLASSASSAGQPGFSVLAASKESLRAMSAVAANEWAGDGIAVVCLEPQVRTSAFGKWAAEYPDAAEAFDHLESAEEFAQRCVACAEGR